MPWLFKVLNTRIIICKNAIIFYRKEVENDSIILFVKLIYIVGIKQYIVSNDKYQLNKIFNLKEVISTYKNVIQEFNNISKK